MTTGFFALCCAAIAALLSFPADAQTYIGITSGRAHAESPCLGRVDCEGRDAGVKVVGGLRLNRHFAIEGAYTEFGRFRGLNSAPANAFAFHSAALSIGGRYDIDMAPKLTAVGRLGLATSKVKFSTSGRYESPSRPSPYLGLGIGYALSDDLTLDGSLDLIGAPYHGDRSRAASIGVGVTYGF